MFCKHLEWFVGNQVRTSKVHRSWVQNPKQAYCLWVLNPPHCFLLFGDGLVPPSDLVSCVWLKLLSVGPRGAGTWDGAIESICHGQLREGVRRAAGCGWLGLLGVGEKTWLSQAWFWSKWLWVKNTGYLKNPIGKWKNQPKPAVPRGFLFDPYPNGTSDHQVIAMKQHEHQSVSLWVILFVVRH